MLKLDDVSDILDEDYHPDAGEELDLYEKQQTYVCAMLCTKVKTSAGKDVVLEEIGDQNARKVWVKLRDHYMSSTQAMLERDDIMESMTTIRLADMNWRRGQHDFILYMLDLFRRHDAYKYPERTDDNLKMTLLQNAVGGVPDLDEVKGQLQIHAAMHGFEPTYDKCVALLKSTASQNDKRIKLHSRSKKAAFKVEVNEHEFDCDKDQDGEDEEDVFSSSVYMDP